MCSRLIVFLIAMVAAAQPAAAQRKGELAVGVGIGLGTRTGPVLTVRSMASDDVGISCRVGGPFRGSAASCGGTFYFSDRQFAVAELGFWTGRRDDRPANRLFASLGTGLTGAGDGFVPVYDVGTTFFFATQTLEEGGWTGFRGDNGWSYFADLYLEKVVHEGEDDRSF